MGPSRSKKGNGISYVGFLQIANGVFHPDLFVSLSGNELKLMLYLTFLRFRFSDQHGLVRGSYSYLEKGTGLSEGTLKRVVQSLSDKKLITVREVNRHRGNLYYVSSRFHYRGEGQSDQIDLTEEKNRSSDQFDLSVRSNLRDRSDASCGSSDQNDLEDNINTSNTGDASRQKVSPGHDLTPPIPPPGGQKGVLTDPIRTSINKIREIFDRPHLQPEPAL